MNNLLINFDPQFINASKKYNLNTILISSKNDNRINEVKNDVIGIVVRLGFIIDKNFINLFNNLKFIATITTGIDHIDEKYCIKKNIQIISLKGEYEFLKSIRATPEHTWGLMLALIRNTIPAYYDVVKGNWNRNNFFGYELYQKTLGIIGFGRVGHILAKYAKAFGMKILFYDEIKISDLNGKQVELDNLLYNADIISVNLTYDISTYHFINQKHFDKMKSGVYLINTSRGAIIDENALINNLKLGKIKGAALDVLEDETSNSGITINNILIKYCRNNPNLIITPHICGSTFESIEKTALFIAKKIRSYINKNY